MRRKGEIEQKWRNYYSTITLPFAKEREEEERKKERKEEIEQRGEMVAKMVKLLLQHDVAFCEGGRRRRGAEKKNDKGE